MAAELFRKFPFVDAVSGMTGSTDPFFSYRQYAWRKILDYISMTIATPYLKLTRKQEVNYGACYIFSIGGFPREQDDP